MPSATLCQHICQISGDQAHLEPWVSGADRAPDYSAEYMEFRQAVQKSANLEIGSKTAWECKFHPLAVFVSKVLSLSRSRFTINIPKKFKFWVAPHNLDQDRCLDLAKKILGVGGCLKS